METTTQPHQAADIKPWQRGLPELLIALGQKMIENGLPLDWMRMSQVTALCRRYRLTWKHQTMKAGDLELYAMDYFDKAAEIYGIGVKVEYKTEWSENKRRQELFIHFRKLYPDGSCA